MFVVNSYLIKFIKCSFYFFSSFYVTLHQLKEEIDEVENQIWNEKYLSV